MSSQSSNFAWDKALIIGIIIVSTMWICDAGPFEKTHPTTNGTDVPFKGSNDSYISPASYTVDAYYGGTRGYACKVTIKGGLAYCNGSSQGVTIYNAPYGCPGAYFCYWGSDPIYF